MKSLEGKKEQKRTNSQNSQKLTLYTDKLFYIETI